MESADDKREFTRVPIRVEADLITADNQTRLSSQTVDVSLKGVLLDCTSSIPPGAHCRVILYLGGREGNVRIEAGGQIARSDHFGVGVQFEELDLESFQHLKNLVLYNSANAAVQVEREFRSHLGLKARHPSPLPPLSDSSPRSGTNR